MFLLTFELWSYLFQNSQEVHDCTDHDPGHAHIKVCWNSSIFAKVLPHGFFDGANQNEANHYSYARPTLMFQSYTGKYLKGSTGMIDLNAVFIYMWHGFQVINSDWGH